MSGKALTTPVAIVAAGALIGLGLYLGRARAPAGDGVVEHASSAAAQVNPRPVGPPTFTTVPQSQVAAEAARALEAQRAALVERCWNPLARSRPTAKPYRCVFTFTFDAGGEQLARGVAEDRANERSELGGCVSSALTSLKIPPPGANTSVEVPFTLP